MTEDEIVEKIQRLPGLLPPASPEAVAETERAVGYPLPPLLRRLYLEGANGGFGPREGILGLAGSDYEHHPDWADITEVREAFNEDGTHPGLLWLFDWGCGIWSVVDCRDPSGPMWGWDPNGPEDADFARLFPQNMKFKEWVIESLNGTLEKAFETSSLQAIAERRRVPDEPGGLPSIDVVDRRDDTEIMAAAAKQGSLPPPASASAVADAEQKIGHHLPVLLRRLYLEVANGGFGPGDGVLGVPGTLAPDHWADIVSQYELFSSGENQLVPNGMVWLCDWGSAVWLLVDCRDDRDSIWVWDPMGPYPRPESLDAGHDEALFPLNLSLPEWLSMALSGTLDEIPASGFRTLARQVE
ncbi:SMI1/KNR4 family protein [Actinomadura sp. KC06]|uniref:SMI1/KNR4 family protein n=1 Tax=Actinomadura sp. KC06 TaxID=2530369 RepID=UPI00105141A3|nr:SMI1/KNR4 family protein [Actinomadura sp. KC06]TDD27269.1 SMI1/KNR4 family protein [Actinomadura sp. KC06]